MLDLFAGIGGASVGAMRSGMEVVAHSEIEPFPCSALEERLPGVPNLGDVSKWREWNWDQIGHVDVVSAGSPCQGMSVAGKRMGLADERSNLFYEAVGIVRRSGARFFVWENVPGVFSSARGHDFAAVLDALADAGALDIAWRVLDAQGFGVPQRRRRIFLVADFGGERAGEILALSEGVPRNSPSGEEAGQEAAGGSGGSPSSNGEPECIDTRSSRGQGKNSGTLQSKSSGGHSLNYIKGETGFALRANPSHSGDKGDGGINTTLVAFQQNQRDEVRLIGGDGQIAGALTAEAGMKQQNYIAEVMKVRRLTPTECERLQGFPDSFTDVHHRGKPAADGPRYRALGNAWAVPCGEFVFRRIARVLT